MDSKVLISKDALCIEYLPVYGNKYWAGKTPNIDELANKGTVFENYYSAAPSSAMSYLSMFTGTYPFQTEMETYRPLKSQYDGITLFDRAFKDGYSCHILWDEEWVVMAKRYSECYGRNTTFHNMKSIEQPVGSHYVHEGVLIPNEAVTENTLQRIENEIIEIMKNEPVFLWIHLPHVINGAVSYGSDIDVFDRCVGIVRKYFRDENIVITADHGNMNGHKGKLCYGFDVYNPAIRIPLITPRKEGIRKFIGNVSSTNMYEVLFDEKLPPTHEFIYSDSAYYVQRHRKLAVIYQNYKYIYNNKTKTEELYDLSCDPNEDFSLMEDYIYDVDRKIKTPSCELYFYTKWDILPNIREKLRMEKDRIWRKPSVRQKVLNAVKDFLRPIYVRLFKAQKVKAPADH
jgi:hypothetical protein